MVRLMMNWNVMHLTSDTFLIQQAHQSPTRDIKCFEIDKHSVQVEANGLTTGRGDRLNMRPPVTQPRIVVSAEHLT